MNILFIGDVVGRPGREAVKKILPGLMEEYNLDFVIANLENATHGKGLNRTHFLEMLGAGIDVVTLGNHFLAKKEILEFIDDYDNVLRPYNLHSSLPGHGSDVYQCGAYKIRVTNLMGRVFMDQQAANPFDAIKEIDKGEDADFHIVDFHAEATGEKQALAWAFDGKLTAVFGTHTHVQTNDLRVLKNGTLFISDVGMCGPYDGILGASKDSVILKTWTGMPTVFGVEKCEDSIFSAVVFTIDEDTKKIIDYKTIYEKIKGCDV